VQHVTIKGIASGLTVQGVGDVSYNFHNNAGEEKSLTLRNYLYVPQWVVRLICPRQIGAETGTAADGFNARHENPILTVNGKPTTIRYESLSNLPILFTTPGIRSYHTYCGALSYNHPLVHSYSAITSNLTKHQRQKLYLHELCAHKGFKNLNRWIRHGKFPGVNPKLADEQDPMCSFYNFGKACHVCHKTHTGQIAKDHTQPGKGVSSDGLESGTPGRPFTTNGSALNLRYNYLSFWVDHMPTFVYITFHASKAATELVRSKTEFEQYAARFNIKISYIRADNGVYSAQLFRKACLKQQQNLTFCAVGAHWPNGIAEWFIGTITQCARTILLHAMTKWPEVIGEDMWTFAL
jgi:hypothetical protein